MQNMTPARLKRTARTVGSILVLIGMPFAINVLCLVPIILMGSSNSGSLQFGVISVVLFLLTVGVGFSAYWHADQSLKDKPSKPMRLPSPILLVAMFAPLLLLGIILKSGDVGFLFVPVLIVCAVLPPLWAIAWMLPQAPARNVPDQADNTDTGQAPAADESTFLTWRRAILVFAAGSTLSVLIALILEILLPLLVLSLVSDLAVTMATNIRALLQALSNAQIARAITNPSFVHIFVYAALIAPIAEEIAKPLVTLPLLRNLNRQQAFWLGALAGAGFAALENVIYAAAGISVWAGILLVRALGSALHPLCSGLVTVAWRDVFHQETNAVSNWWRRFGVAVAIHAVWNGGSLLVIALGSAGFLGALPPTLDVLGVSAAGTVLAFLLLAGMVALWLGRIYGHDLAFISSQKEHPQSAQGNIPSDRAVAIWAVICLVAILPIGIAGLNLWLR